MLQQLWSFSFLQQKVFKSRYIQIWVHKYYIHNTNMLLKPLISTGKDLQPPKSATTPKILTLPKFHLLLDCLYVCSQTSQAKPQVWSHFKALAKICRHSLQFFAKSKIRCNGHTIFALHSNTSAPIVRKNALKRLDN